VLGNSFHVCLLGNSFHVCLLEIDQDQQGQTALANLPIEIWSLSKFDLAAHNQIFVTYDSSRQHTIESCEVSAIRWQ
jgi:hypothetical protein